MPFRGQLFVAPFLTNKLHPFFATKEIVTKPKENFGSFSLSSRLGGALLVNSGLFQKAAQNHQPTNPFPLSQSHRCEPPLQLLRARPSGLPPQPPRAASAAPARCWLARAGGWASGLAGSAGRAAGRSRRARSCPASASSSSDFLVGPAPAGNRPGEPAARRRCGPARRRRRCRGRPWDEAPRAPRPARLRGLARRRARGVAARGRRAARADRGAPS
jgi:hypothetical protein